MEVENQVSFISPMLQNTQFGNVDDETTITFKEDVGHANDNRRIGTRRCDRT